MVALTTRYVATRRYTKWVDRTHRLHASAYACTHECMHSYLHTCTNMSCERRTAEVTETRNGKHAGRERRRILRVPIGMAALQWYQAPWGDQRMCVPTRAMPSDLRRVPRLLSAAGSMRARQIRGAMWLKSSLRAWRLRPRDHGVLASSSSSTCPRVCSQVCETSLASMLRACPLSRRTPWTNFSCRRRRISRGRRANEVAEIHVVAAASHEGMVAVVVLSASGRQAVLSACPDIVAASASGLFPAPTMDVSPALAARSATGVGNCGVVAPVLAGP